MTENNDSLDLDNELKSFNTETGTEGELPYAVATLVLGILSILGCFTYGIIGLICGIIALSLHSKDKSMYEKNKAFYDKSYKVASAGNVCAIIGTVLSAIGLLFLLLLIAGVALNG
ncbi:MAG: hypothetical protein DCO96_13210 [Fluviicola sp. XM-24bin1]|nr:MAG: hypothetical protein DCO96_13210 [Fluviicola sp. XM-24bin1]